MVTMTKVGNHSAAYAETLDLTGAAIIAGTAGSWVTGLDEFVITGWAVEYIDADGITMTDVDIQFDVRISGDATIYVVTTPGKVAYEELVDTEGNYFYSFMSTVNSGNVDLTGIDSIRARVSDVNGTGPGTTDQVRVTVVGREAVWML